MPTASDVSLSTIYSPVINYNYNSVHKYHKDETRRQLVLVRREIYIPRMTSVANWA